MRRLMQIALKEQLREAISCRLQQRLYVVRCTLYVVEASVQFLDVAKQGDKKIDRIVNRVQF